MSDHVIAYNPSDTVIDRLLEHGNLISEWGKNNDKELLFKLHNHLSNSSTGVVSVTCTVFDGDIIFNTPINTTTRSKRRITANTGLIFPFSLFI